MTSIQQLNRQDISAGFTDTTFHTLFIQAFLEHHSPNAHFWGIDAQSLGLVHPSIGFNLYNPQNGYLPQWVKWVYHQKITLMAGELNSHLALLQAMASDPQATKLVCGYEIQDFCTLPKVLTPDEKAERVGEQALDELVSLYAQAEKENLSARTLNDLQETLQVGRIYCLRQKGQIVAAALTHRETQSAGMIGGVYTLPEYRGRGFSAACVSSLCTSLQNDHKTPCLFYAETNHTARHLYQKLGFEKYGQWLIVEFNWRC